MGRYSAEGKAAVMPRKTPSTGSSRTRARVERGMMDEEGQICALP
ncbi:hypothetical protein PRUB_b0209 [Pseudoalteromonas rubra]|uniref:Uncharacterized protein n=1 Tax=Pseudoalteromonas rubra TaxID=43658 RepID=A0A8T0C067_9GAMM|nr:hypothetical protein PRUB_b0209 [Pseudoalteromonas rubra]